ncbi:MAG TPA: complex I subunit 1 family protein [Anaerolineales bacterium]|nr:complex I subunit 1 family protein [Anaerolineales bacterium]
MSALISLLLFPAGLSLLLQGLAYEWADRKLIARMQNRIGPRWFQPLADAVKLLAKEEIVPQGVNVVLFMVLPVVALTGALTAALYVPLLGFAPMYSFRGDLIVAVYLLSLLTLCTGLAGANTPGRFSVIGATRALTQMFSYEAPFMLALLGPAIAARSWQIGEITMYAETRWLVLTQPVGLVIALVGLLGKLEMPPFDAPEAETEIVAGALTEYSGRGLALFHLGRNVELVIGLSLVAAFYLGGVAGPLAYFAKTLALVFLLALIQTLMTRLRIDQTVGLWWRFGTLLMLGQVLVLLIVMAVHA